MRIFQERELIRLHTMLTSNDEAMVKLAMSIITSKRFHFNILTILAFHAALLIITVSLMVYIATMFILGFYLLSMILFIVFQTLGSIVYVVNLVDFRKSYNELL